MTTPLPEFENPPVTEVVLGVQFERLQSMRTPQLGHVWRAFRTKFPKTLEQLPLDPVIEWYGAKRRPKTSLSIEPLSTLPPPRLWFLDDSETALVQIQQDRFIRNWRKRTDEHEYPRYKLLREEFAADFQCFHQSVADLGIEPFQFNQCELTYVNVIPAGCGWNEPGELGSVFTLFRPEYSDTGLGIPEEAVVKARYLLRHNDAPVGRMHVAVAPVVSADDDATAFRLSLTARGMPIGDNIDGVMRFLDLGHEAIVRGFASLTTPPMHNIWGRKS